MTGFGLSSRTDGGQHLAHHSCIAWALTALREYRCSDSAAAALLWGPLGAGEAAGAAAAAADAGVSPSTVAAAPCWLWMCSREAAGTELFQGEGAGCAAGTGVDGLGTLSNPPAAQLKLSTDMCDDT